MAARGQEAASFERSAIPSSASKSAATAPSAPPFDPVNAVSTGFRAETSQPEYGLIGGLTAEQRLELVREGLEDGKAEDIVVIDLKGKSSIADYMVIASGRSTRHVISICERVIELMKERGGPKPRAEGMENGDWVLIDAIDIVAHVFRPEVREFYALEKMWSPSAKAKPRSADKPRSVETASPDDTPTPDDAD